MIYLKYTESHHGGEICAGQENDDWPSHEDEVITWHPISLTRIHMGGETEQLKFDVTTDNAYLVVARYFSGGTFGRTCGYWQVVGLTETGEEALALKGKIESEYRKYCESGSKPYKGEWQSWYGYFEGLEDVEIHFMPVGK